MSHQSQHHAGFTLVEVMLALTMSSAIIILAYSAIRTGSRVMALADAQARQGEFVTTAYLITIKHGLNARMDAAPTAPLSTPYSLYGTGSIPSGWVDAADANLYFPSTPGTCPYLSYVDPATGASFTIPMSTTSRF